MTSVVTFWSDKTVRWVFASNDRAIVDVVWQRLTKPDHTTLVHPRGKKPFHLCIGYPHRHLNGLWYMELVAFSKATLHAEQRRANILIAELKPLNMIGKRLPLPNKKKCHCCMHIGLECGGTSTICKSWFPAYGGEDCWGCQQSMICKKKLQKRGGN